MAQCKVMLHLLDYFRLIPESVDQLVHAVDHDPGLSHCGLLHHQHGVLRPVLDGWQRLCSYHLQRFLLSL